MAVNREIKFRVWDNEEKCFVDEYYDDTFMYTLSFSGKFVYAFKTHKVSNCPNWQISQYTGLKDKNGVEIYEGDILSSDTSEFIVSFEDGSFVIVHQPTCGYEIEGETKRDVLNKWCIDIYSLEVIGNIYENKELLEQ